jgi:cellulose synthase/poly-beta-1,6-N-acetylglucosamine synthase-like glycosyltransferase
MTLIIAIFWISLSVLFFCYIGYGIILYLLNTLLISFKRTPEQKQPDTVMPVTLIVASYNEETVLEKKLRNTLEIDYPADKLHIIFITDGSTDNSVAIIKKYPPITLLHDPGRKGKLSAIKRAMLQVKTPVVIFSDANTMLNKDCIQKIVQHYQHSGTGGVAGEKKIITGNHPSVIGAAEGLYWKYESFLKKQDAAFNTVVGAAGELFSIRTSLFRELKDELILDDFIISMQVCLQGYKIAYEPGAFATELPSSSLAEEEKRKVRIAAGAYQSIKQLKDCLNFFKHPLLAFQYVSRRLLRWVCCPLLLIVLLLTDFFIVSKEPAAAFYSWFLYGQLFFYGLALLGWWLVSTGKKAGLIAIPFYFVFMNYCLVKGFFRFVKGSQTVLWEKSLRQAVE